MVKIVSRENCILSFINIHGNKFDYSEFEYKSYNSKGTILCLKCGEKFDQTPGNHIRAKGCPYCLGKRSNTSYFIKKSIELHGNKYIYTNVKYINKYTPVDIKCKKHGIFQQRPNHHLSGCGCPFCNDSKGEIHIRNYFEYNKINYIQEKSFENCLYKSKLKFDFFIPTLNTCIEYDGIQHFQPREKFGGQKEFENTQRRDKIKTNYCIKNNIKLIRIKYTKRNIEKNINNILEKELK